MKNTTFRILIYFFVLCFTLISNVNSICQIIKRERSQNEGTKYSYNPNESSVSGMSFSDARDNLINAFNNAEKISLSVDVKGNSLISVPKSSKENINLIKEISVTENICEIKYEFGKDKYSFVYFYSRGSIPNAFEIKAGAGKKIIKVDDNTNGLLITWEADEKTADTNAKLFLDALYYLKTVYSTKKIENFKEKADKYKSNNTGSEITEDMRKCIVQATTLTKEKKYEDAIKLYEKAIGLEDEYPDAHFNYSLLLAELKDFKSAICEMKKYLMLVPDAKDSRAAQDKIYEWELKIK